MGKPVDAGKSTPSMFTSDQRRAHRVLFQPKPMQVSRNMLMTTFVLCLIHKIYIET